MNKEQYLRRLEQGWTTFLQSFEGLPDSAIVEPGAVGHWSVRDVLAHVTTWEEEALKKLPCVLENEPFPRYGRIDAFNAREWERKRGLSLDQVKYELDSTHKRLLFFLQGCPESAYATGSRLLKELRLFTYSHYQEHASQICAWRSERGL